MEQVRLELAFEVDAEVAAGLPAAAEKLGVTVEDLVSTVVEAAVRDELADAADDCGVSTPAGLRAARFRALRSGLWAACEAQKGYEDSGMPFDTAREQIAEDMDIQIRALDQRHGLGLFAPSEDGWGDPVETGA